MFMKLYLPQCEKNVRYGYHKFPPKIKGLVYFSGKRYYIVLNKNITKKSQVLTLYHEIKHILYDLKTGQTLININGQWKRIEKEADSFAENIMKKFYF
ncbi:MAG: ImmA/IrrE family metallo-endopeptidase [Candidatus Woesearchaeota archaeon]